MAELFKSFTSNLTGDELIFYLFIPLILIMFFLVFKSKIKKAIYKKKAERTLSMLSPSRRITQEERIRIREVYTSFGKIPNDAPVFTTSGPYEEFTLNKKEMGNTDHYINFFYILWLPAFDGLKEEMNTIEFVLNHRGEAVVLTLNNKYSILKDYDNSRSETSKEQFHPEHNMEKRERLLTEIETSWLSRGEKGEVSFLLLFISVLSVQGLNEKSIWLLSALLFIALLRLIKRERVKKTDSSEILLIKGTVKKIRDNSYRIASWPVVFPQGVETQAGNYTEAEVYSPEKTYKELKVLGEKESWSLNQNWKYRKFYNKKRYVYQVLSSGFSLFYLAFMKKTGIELMESLVFNKSFTRDTLFFGILTLILIIVFLSSLPGLIKAVTGFRSLSVRR